MYGNIRKCTSLFLFSKIIEPEIIGYMKKHLFLLIASRDTWLILLQIITNAWFDCNTMRILFFLIISKIMTYGSHCRIIRMRIGTRSFNCGNIIIFTWFKWLYQLTRQNLITHGKISKTSKWLLDKWLKDTWNILNCISTRFRNWLINNRCKKKSHPVIIYDIDLMNMKTTNLFKAGPVLWWVNCVRNI